MQSKERAVAAAGFAAFVNVYAPQSILPTLSRSLHASHQAVSLTIGATTLAVALASPFAGTLAARWPRRPAVALSMAALSLCTLLGGTACDLHQLLFWRFLQGLALPLVVSTMMAFIAQEWEGPAMGQQMANYITWSVVGGFCGRFLCGTVGAHIGWRGAMVLLGLLNAAGGAALVYWLPPGRSGSPPRSVLAELASHLRSRDLQVAYLAGFNVLFSLIGLFTYVTFYLTRSPFSLGPVALSSVFFVYIVGIIVTPLGGRVIARFGFGPGLELATWMVAAGIICTLSQSLPVVLLGLALSSSGGFISQAAAAGYVGQRAGKRRASALGLYLSCYYLGGSCGAAFLGFFWEAFGWTGCVVVLLLVQAVNLAACRRFGA